METIKNCVRFMKSHPIEAAQSVLSGMVGGALIGLGIYVALVSMTKE